MIVAPKHNPHISWNTTPEEEALCFPCDRHAVGYAGTYYRAISIQAPPSRIYRWLLQMRLAPYSYDWINHLGRQSPRRLATDAVPLAKGQSMMIIFDVIEFEENRSITLKVRPHSFWEWLFGGILLSYLILPRGESCRMIVKIHRSFRRSPLGVFMKYFLPWANLIMHRKQLHLFKQLAEAGR